MKCAVFKRLENGFTLVELLIAASIFSILILSLYSAFQTGILSYNKIDSALGVYQTARILFNKIELDLKNAFIYSDKESMFKGTVQGLEFISIIDSFAKGKKYSNICRVRYELNNDALKRSIYKGIDAFKENPEVESEELSSDVKEISFQYAYTTKDPDKPYDWQDIWPKEKDASQLVTLPLAVKIKLSLSEKNRQQKEIGIVEFNKTVSLPLGIFFSN